MTQSFDDNAWPGSAVALVEARWGSSWYSGTGFLVGRNALLTAGHMTFNFGRAADEIRVAFSFNPAEASRVTYAPAALRGFSDFDDTPGDSLIVSGDGRAGSLAGSEKDIALLAFSVPVGDRFGWLAMDFGAGSGPASVMGYPGALGFRPSLDSGPVLKSRVDNVFDIHALGVQPGESGAPILMGDARAVGLVSTGGFATALAGHADWLVPEIALDLGYLTAGADVFRFYNPRTGVHFYTASQPEAQGVMAWMTYEGSGFASSATAATGAAVQRFYNRTNDTHFWTINAEEAAQVARDPAQHDEGTAFFAFATGGPGREAIHRFYHAASGSHFYTASEAEAAHVRATDPGMRFEGTAFWVDAALY